jgi:hypothetical protein
MEEYCRQLLRMFSKRWIMQVVPGQVFEKMIFASGAVVLFEILRTLVR